ncbi:MAG: hypothetical protein AB1500_07355 [Bacillota bacterium]
MDKPEEERFRKIERFAAAALLCGTTLFTCVLALSRWPRWWELILPELSPMGWMESLLLYTVALTGFLCALLCYLRNDSAGFKLWGLFGLGFILLSLDERLAVHERLRDGILAPAKLKVPLFFWTDYGDFILLLVLVIGLIFGVKIIRLFRRRQSAFRWFLAAAAFSVAAVLMDSFSYYGYSIDIQRLEQFIEELFEVGAMLSFFNAAFFMFMHYLREILGPSHP